MWFEYEGVNEDTCSVRLVVVNEDNAVTRKWSQYGSYNHEGNELITDSSITPIM